MVSRSSKTLFGKPIFSIENFETGNFALSLTSKNTLYRYKAIDSPEGLGGLSTAERLKHFHMNREKMENEPFVIDPVQGHHIL